MTVTLAKTAKKYYGCMAANYESKRSTQQRWAIENDVVSRMLTALRPESVLDVPVGTGRFLALYRTLKVGTVRGVDISEEMLALARRKPAARHAKLEVGSALEVEGACDVAVCVRFLDLMEDTAMVAVLERLAKCARRAIVLTIRLGDEYIAKSNTATHSRRQFASVIKRLGWEIGESVPVFEQGWFVMRLQRRTNSKKT